MSEKQFRSVAGTAPPIRVVRVQRTCGSCPAQWDGLTHDGRKVYARYRGSHGSVRVAEAGDLSEFAAVNGATVVSFERIETGKSGGWDGDLSESELRSVTSPYVIWPSTMRDADIGEDGWDTFPIYEEARE